MDLVPGRRTVLIPLLALIFAAQSWARAYTNLSSVLDASGDRAGSGSYTNVHVAAQPGGTTLSTNAYYHNYAGFLGTFSLQPDLDTDGDGLANEVDIDNDADGLIDAIEIAGSAFVPGVVTEVNAADTDGDGATDWEESVAGTDPLDEAALLMITSIEKSGGNATVEWRARGGKIYNVIKHDGAITGASEVIATKTPTGGSPPWNVVTSSFVDTNAAAADARFYRVKIAP